MSPSRACVRRAIVCHAEGVNKIHESWLRSRRFNRRFINAERKHGFYGARLQGYGSCA